MLSSCGTVVSRVHADHIGAYPGEAILFDAWLIAAPFSGAASEPGARALLLGLLSLPFDAVLDVLLLPADLVGWPFGLRKTHSR